MDRTPSNLHAMESSYGPIRRRTRLPSPLDFKWIIDSTRESDSRIPSSSRQLIQRFIERQARRLPSIEIVLQRAGITRPTSACSATTFNDPGKLIMELLRKYPLPSRRTIFLEGKITLTEEGKQLLKEISLNTAFFRDKYRKLFDWDFILHYFDFPQMTKEDLLKVVRENRTYFGL